VRIVNDRNFSHGRTRKWAFCHRSETCTRDMAHKRERFYGAAPPTSFFPPGAHGGWFLNVPKSVAEFGRCCAQQVKERIRSTEIPSHPVWFKSSFARGTITRGVSFATYLADAYRPATETWPVHNGRGRRDSSKCLARGCKGGLAGEMRPCNESVFELMEMRRESRWEGRETPVEKSGRDTGYL
jgi:hypothetical protein